MADTQTIIIEEGRYQLVRMDTPTFGGRYAVVNNGSKKARTGLCLDSAFEIFSKLTLKQKLEKL